MDSVILYSSHRQNSSDTPTSFNLNLNSQPLRGRYKLDYIFYPNTQYNINSTNNKVYFTDTGARTGTITPGYYTSSNFHTAVQTAMNSAPSSAGDYTVTISSTSSKLTVAKGASTFSFTFGTNTSNSARKSMGFASSDASAGASQVGAYPVNLSERQCLLFDLGVKSGFSTSDGRGYNFFLPVNVNSGEIITYNSEENAKQAIEFENPVQTLSIKVYDESGNLYDSNNADWFLKLSRCY